MNTQEELAEAFEELEKGSFIKTERNRAEKTRMANIVPNTESASLNIGSVLRVAVEGRPPK